ncbi:hypothetical protein Pla123a_12280 [Posidoniimonas polymericola]|uniref:PEP-CTERM protein-sorting domain-containing protein n=1 Tax=Posidoniimonas polymericola TaxID=2528002 RepID=A0A5C5YUI6_9BACT|nr:PEP-CTERM sorting domain-containing protein [Posidoniimonas polymericola]TWT78436.1 hypothetical protein Pla123a_12280 [Posidoniimonas polymericola]
MKKILCMAAMLLPACYANGAVIVDEDFDSYADTTALGGVWSLGDGTLDTVLGNPSQSLYHPGTGASFSGANTNSLSFAEIAPGPGEKLVFSADIYDDGASANKRTSAGLREAAGANIIEMGMYNSPNHYAYRAILFGPGDPSWVAFSGLVDDGGAAIENEPVEGWHRFTAEVTATNIDFMLDLNSDGTINATASVPIAPNDLGFDIIRLGGPSDLGSAGGGANFDNISLELVPEPASLAMGLLSVIGLVGVRRRR